MAFVSFLVQCLVQGIPILLAITLHEAAHGFVALWHGDDTALRLGRVSLNPFRHLDLLGTILLPGFLFLVGAPFLFGYAKPVPVNFSRLRNPRKDIILVAAAGPAMNVALAILSVFLLRLNFLFPMSASDLLSQGLQISILINVVLAVFNMLPLPPLDGGRVAVGILPNALALPLARLEPWGFALVLALFIGVPWFFSNFGLEISIFGWILEPIVRWIIKGILSFGGWM